MKAEIEQRFGNNKLFKVMRLSYVWSLNDKFTKYLLSSSKRKATVDIFDPFIRSVICLQDVMSFIIKFIELPNSIPGIVNLAGPEFISRVQLVKEISKYVPLSYRVTQPNKDFFKYRPDQILMQSIYLDKVIGNEALSVDKYVYNSFNN
jgi:dTDP-4-dehydrorhamnose reductase